MDFKEVILSPVSAERERLISLFISTLQSSNPLLSQVLDHLKLTSGKKMRPMLVLLAAKLFGEINDVTYNAAISLELLHNASLVHDDVVDESNERRGLPSVNAVYNNKVAVLSGDFLLATSLLEAYKTRNLRIIEIISQLGRELADGEILQLYNNSNEEHSFEIYFKVIRKKTAVLFEACAAIGALSVNASEEQIAIMRRFGELIGICYQIKDDIFDYISSSQQLGKPTGNDIQEGKLTLPILYALNKTHDTEALRLAAKVKSRTVTPDEIAWLIRFTIEQGGIKYAEKVMDDYRNEAHELLLNLPENSVKVALLAYLDYVILREK